MRTGAIYRDGACLIPRVWRADSMGPRMRGLLGRRPLRADAAEALLLMPCNSVHTFGMRYPLDVVFLDAQERVLGWHRNLRPWRFGACWGARCTLELMTGGLDRLHPQCGEQWTWQAV